ncbi:MAG TPA: hypothetical protein VGD10_03940 [Allosphingosinicella sp.]|uniref:tetratricopeptide repeat protein n=1 Tax=Allosphingosinicella sp. TaxID=2823234 RepID=UPI002ED986CE
MTELGSIRCLPLSGATLPVRIRDASGTVIVEGMSGRNIDVPAGSYYIGTLLPDGEELLASEPIEVVAGQVADATLGEFEESMTSLSASDAAMDTPMPVVRRWQGDWLSKWSERKPLEADDEQGFLKEAQTLDWERSVIIEREFGTDDLLVIEHEGQRSFHILPLDECFGRGDLSGTRRSISLCLKPSNNGVKLSFSSAISPATNTFLEFVNQGLLSESRVISTDLMVQEDSGLRSPQSSLLRAVLGAYVLLRANQLEGLDRWIQQLIELAPEMPDAYALQAEALARCGDHEGAVGALRRGLEKPCPWFRSGVSYSLERLRLYIDLHVEPKVGFNLSAEDIRKFKARKAQLERAANHLDTNALFATFK